MSPRRDISEPAGRRSGWRGPSATVALMAGSTPSSGRSWTAPQTVLVVVGVAAFVTAAVPRESEAATVCFAVLGGVLILAATFYPRVRVAKLPGGGEIHLDAERTATINAASVDVPLEVVEREIASTDDGPPTPSEKDEEVAGTLNFLAANIAMAAVLAEARSDGQPLEGCTLRLYLLDVEEQVLRSVMSAPRPEGDGVPWEIGQGATGTAYASGNYTYAEGEAVWDGTYKLTPSLQRRYRDLAAVASMPVMNGANDVIAVLTASTRDPETRLGTDEATEDLLLRALLLSRILIELLQWFPDFDHIDNTSNPYAQYIERTTSD